MTEPCSPTVEDAVEAPSVAERILQDRVRRLEEQLAAEKETNRRFIVEMDYFRRRCKQAEKDIASCVRKLKEIPCPKD